MEGLQCNIINFLMSYVSEGVLIKTVLSVLYFGTGSNKVIIHDSSQQKIEVSNLGEPFKNHILNGYFHEGLTRRT